MQFCNAQMLDRDDDAHLYTVQFTGVTVNCQLKDEQLSVQSNLGFDFDKDELAHAVTNVATGSSAAACGVRNGWRIILANDVSIPALEKALSIRKALKEVLDAVRATGSLRIVFCWSTSEEDETWNAMRAGDAPRLHTEAEREAERRRKDEFLGRSAESLNSLR
jgi:predicted metalloprotease with PDZ domain